MLGYLEGGAEAVPAADRRSTQRLGAAELSTALAADDAPLVLDVRQPGERANQALEPSLHIPLGELEARAGELPRDRPIVVHCATGYRSMVAASLLEAAGFEAPRDLEGGIEAWAEAGLPTVSTEGAACP